MIGTRQVSQPIQIPESHQEPRTVGDITITFAADAKGLPTRSAHTEWTAQMTCASWTLWDQPASQRWHGFKLTVIREEGWTLWLLGELFASVQTSSQSKAILLDVVTGRESARRLNGRFLLFGWHAKTRQWHIWTDRFGTLHAYYANDGQRAAIGTFFAATAAAASRRQLDWVGLSGYFAFAFFPQDRTFFEDVRILRPASRYAFDENGRLLTQERYWNWHHKPDARRSYDDTVAEFGEVFAEALAEQTREGRIALPISGGLDSRATVAALTQAGAQPEDRLWSYSYGYSDDSIETRIARQIASTRRLPFQSYTIRPYLFDRLDAITASVEGFQDVTQSRQAFIAEQIAQHSDRLVAAHWGDVWLDDCGLAGQDNCAEDDVLACALGKFEKGGRQWLLKNLCREQLGAAQPEMMLRDMVRDELKKVEHVADADFRVKALKTDQWSFRWTLASLRMFQSAADLCLPFYDTRVADFFCSVPSRFVQGRRLQVDYLKRFAPDLARVKWQAYDTNLFRYRHFNSWLLPKRAAGRIVRTIKRKSAPARNWEVQFLNDAGREGLRQWLLKPSLRLLNFVSPDAIRRLLEAFYAAPLEEKRGYTISMLLTFSAWLERIA